MPLTGSGRGRIAEASLRVAPALAGSLATLVAAVWSAERAAAPATAWLGLSSTAVIAPLLLVASRSSLPLAMIAVLAPCAAIYAPREGALPLALCALLFAAAVAIGVADRAVDVGRRLGAAGWLALVGSVQIALGFDRLWTGRDLADWLAWGVLSLASALLFARLEAASGRRVFWIFAAFVAAGPGATFVSVTALAIATWRVSARPATAAAAPALIALAAASHEPWWAALALAALAALAGAAAGTPPLAVRIARPGLALLALGALLAASPPWSRARPVGDLLRGVVSPPSRGIETVAGAAGSSLSAARPLSTWQLSGRPIRALTVDSFLSEAISLECGLPVARVRLSAPGHPPVEADLTVGSDVGEWAATRPDVEPRLACRRLEPYVLWLPASGRSLGSTFRARLALDEPYSAERIEIELVEGLPEATRLHVERIGSAQ